MEKAIEIFKDSCKQLGIGDELPVVKNKKYEKQTHAGYMLDIIAEARNKSSDFKADWTNYSQRKWYPVFAAVIKEGMFSGFRFGGSGCGYSRTFAGGGSRLCFKTEEDSNWFAQEDLMPLHNQWLVIQK